MKPISLFRVNIDEAAIKAASEVMRSGYVAEGPKVKEFERQFSKVLDDEAHTCAVNSGTSAITLAVRLALGSRTGSRAKIATTPMTCVATNLPILTCDAQPVFCDIDPKSGLIDPESVYKLAREEGCAAVICVDWGGAPSPVRDLKGAIGLPVIEDAAHALGSRHHSRGYVDHTSSSPTGTVADFTCFSFQAIKHLTTGDGGMLTIPKSDPFGYYEIARRLRWFGIDRDAVPVGDSRISLDISRAGYKFHMNDISAALGIAGLANMESTLFAHRLHAQDLASRLDPAFKVAPSHYGVSSHWVLTVLLPAEGLQEEFRLFMQRHGIQVSQVHRRNDTYTVFKKYATRKLPGVAEFTSRMMCLPCHSGLSEEDIARIADTANSFW